MPLTVDKRGKDDVTNEYFSISLFNTCSNLSRPSDQTRVHL